MKLNTTNLGILKSWYNDGYVVAYGYTDNSRKPIKTDWIVNIDRVNGRLYVKNGFYEISEEITDINKAVLRFNHLGFSKW